MSFEVGDVIQVKKTDAKGLRKRAHPFYMCLGIIVKIDAKAVFVLFYNGSSRNLTGRNWFIVPFPADQLKKVGVAAATCHIDEYLAKAEEHWATKRSLYGWE